MAAVTAARWKTTDTPDMARATTAPSMRSVGTHCSRLADRTSTRTRHPSPSSVSMRCPPTNPLAPVTSASRSGNRLVVDPIGLVGDPTDLLDRLPHERVVLENPGRLSVRHPALQSVPDDRQVHELGHPGQPVLRQHAEGQHTQ